MPDISNGSMFVSEIIMTCSVIYCLSMLSSSPLSRWRENCCPVSDDCLLTIVTVPVFSVYISSNQAAGHGQSRARHGGHGDSDAARCYDDSTLVNTSVETINQLLRLLLPGLQGTQSGRMIRTVFVSSSLEWIYRDIH